MGRRKKLFGWAAWVLLLLSGTSCRPGEEAAAGEEALAYNPVAEHGQLRVQGNRIVNQHGQPVQLRGMSFFWSQWMGRYYTPQTVQWLKDDWRCSLVRAAMGVEMNGYLQHPGAEKQKVMAVVEGAIAAGVYVIIDWHDHRAEEHQQEAIVFFGEMAQRYGQHPNVIYEIYNEPLDVSWSGVIKPYSEAVLAAIRQHDPDNLVVCGTPKWSQRVDEAAADPIADPNVAYALHFYAATHKQELRDIATSALNQGVALMVTEFGTAEANGSGYLDEAEMRTWWEFMEKHHLSWANWSVSSKDETTAALKPGTRATGGWAKDELSPSGRMVRQELRGRQAAGQQTPSPTSRPKAGGN